MVGNEPLDDADLPLSRCAFLRDKEKVTRAGEQRWRDPGGGRYYILDRSHSEVEVFSARGYHLGAVDPESGEFIKQAVKGRTIDV